MPIFVPVRARRAADRAPTWPYRLNARHPIAHGLRHYLPLGEGAGLSVDLVTGSPLSLLSTPEGTWQPDRFGMAWNQPNVSPGTGGLRTQTEINVGTRFTLAAWGQTSITGTGSITLAAVDQLNSTSRQIVVQRVSFSNFARAILTTSGQTTITLAGAITTINDGVPHLYTVVKRGVTGLQLYIDGRLEAEDTTTEHTPGIVGPLCAAEPGSGKSTSNRAWVGQSRLAGYWDRDLSPAEIRYLYSPEGRFSLLDQPRTFVAVPAGAVLTEAMAPNTVLATANLQDSGLNAPPINTADIDDDPATPDASWWTAVNVGLATEARVGFPTPSTGTPTGTQTVYIWARKTAGAPNPTVDVELWENGSFVATLLDDVAITSTTGQLLTATFNAAGSPPSLSNPADVEIRIVSTPGVAA